MLLLVVGWTTVTHFSGVSLKSIFIDYSLSKIVLLELLQIRVNTFDNSGTQETPLAPYSVFAQSSNWLPWCTS